MEQRDIKHKVMCCFPTTNVNAKNGVQDNSDRVFSEKVLYNFNGKTTPDVLQQKLERHDVALKEDTRVKIVQLEDNSDATALVITNKEDEMLIQDVILDFGDDGEVQPINVGLESAGASTRAGSTVTQPSNASYSIKATAVYNQKIDNNLLSSYFQPVGAYFFYYNTGSSTVSYIKIQYETVGYLYSYNSSTGATAKLSDTQTEYVIPVEKSSPATSTMYQTVKTMSSDRVIWTGTGLNSGLYMQFQYVVNGSTRTTAVAITP